MIVTRIISPPIKVENLIIGKDKIHFEGETSSNHRFALAQPNGDVILEQNKPGKFDLDFTPKVYGEYTYFCPPTRAQ